jgi:hypothetical protein
MPKAIIIADLRYKKRGQVKSLRNVLKYLQYRDGSVRREAYLGADLDAEVRYPEGLSDYVKPTHRETRWVDRGMGDTYRQITNRAYDWRGRSVLARTWVISPDPELMQHVPEDKRFEIVGKVTERTVERWYSDNGWGQPEYSYVIHDKHITDKRSLSSSPERLLPMVHAHVITPGTIPIDAAEDLGRVDHYVKKPHFRDLNHTAAEAFEQELGHMLGRERAQEIITERNARIERERYPDRDRYERMQQLKAFADIMMLLQAEKAARQAKKRKKQRQQDARRRMAELRMYARYVNEDRQKRREADWRRVAIARREQHETDLQQERDKQERRMDRARSKHQRVRDMWDEEAQKMDALRAYFGGLFADQELAQEPQIETPQQELEH